MKITDSDMKRALAKLGMLAYWPNDEATRSEIGILLAKMCPHREALLWFVEAMVNDVNKWPGPAEARGILCTRYKPADGVEKNSTIYGYRPVDGEQRSIDQHEAMKTLEPPRERSTLTKAGDVKVVTDLARLLTSGKPQ